MSQPAFVRGLRYLMSRFVDARRQRGSRGPAGNEYRKTVFREIWSANRWGSTESVSGPGSTLDATGRMREVLPRLLREHHCATVLDVACGDFNWMQHVDMGPADYVGCDIVEEVVTENRRRFGNSRRRFLLMDAVADEWPSADLVICRDLFLHLSFADIDRILLQVWGKALKLALLSSHPVQQANVDIVTGGGRTVNLLLSPFSLPSPDTVIDESFTNTAGVYWPRETLVYSVQGRPHRGEIGRRGTEVPR